MGAAGAMALGGGFLGAVGSLAQGQAQAKMAEYNAVLARRNARLTLEQAKREAYLVRKEGFKSLGATRAAVGASGLTLEGSFRDVLSESAMNVKRDEMTVKYQGQLSAINFEIEARQQEQFAKVAKIGGAINAASSLLSGGARAASFSNVSRIPRPRNSGTGGFRTDVNTSSSTRNIA